MPQNNTILIVDDEPSARDTLEAFLYPTGYELAFAHNGAEALDLAEEIEPNLILLDVMMPDMDGFEVCQRLRQNPHLAEVHIIMVTALDDRDSRIRGLSVGADEFISKPFDGVELEARVKTVMKLSRYRQLLAERTKFEWIVEQANEGYLLIDGPGHILYANNQARLYLGFAVDDEHASTRKKKKSPRRFWNWRNDTTRSIRKARGPTGLPHSQKTRHPRVIWCVPSPSRRTSFGYKWISSKQRPMAVTDTSSASKTSPRAL